MRDVARTLLRQAAPTALAPAVPDHTADVARLEAALADLDAQRAQAQRLALRRLLSEDDLAARQNELDTERKGLEAQLARLKDTAAAQRRRARAQSELAGLMADLEKVLEWPVQQLNAHLAQIFEQIVVERRRVIRVHLRE